MTPSTEVIWRPSEELIRNANWTAFVAAAGVPDYYALAARASAEPEWFWNSLIRFLGIRFYRPYEQVLDLSRGLPHPRWCVGGTTNYVLNALDRHPPEIRAKPAIVFEPESGPRRVLTYADLDAEVCRFASGLAARGLKRGEVIAIFMPMVPETVVAFLAVVKLGCIALPLFSGFGAEALATRMQEADAVAIVTVDAAMRRGQAIGMKQIVDEAACRLPALRKIIVHPRAGVEVAMQPGRDLWWRDVTDGQPATYPTAEVDAMHPLMVIFTSGTTGKPKGIVHTHAGFSVKMGQDTHLSWDLQPSDRLLFMADFGWLAGPMTVSAFMLNGATYVLAEGAPDYPEPDRFWQLIGRHRVTFVGVAPTLVRGLRRNAASILGAYDFSSLRLLTSSGETIDPELWIWIHRNICREKAPIVNLSGGTELGTIVCSNILFPIKPASFNGGVPGVGADIVDANGRSVGPDEVGELVMREPCIGRTHELWKSPERYLDSYWGQIPGMWTHGDWASRDADGYWYLHGRSDDTIKVSGKRTGPAEIEALMLATHAVSEAAAVAVPDAIKGSAVACVAVAAPGRRADAALARELEDAVIAGFGTSFRPRSILFVDDLPKTRNMKVMRRVIRAALTGEAPGDLSSLVNPHSFEALRAAAAASGNAPWRP